MVVQHKFDPEDWLRLVQTYGVTTTFTAPTPIRMVCNLPATVKDRYDRSSMKRLIANAAPWTLALKKMYLADFPPDSLWEVYGSTELGVDTVLRPGGPSAQARIVRAGRARASRSSSSTTTARRSPSRSSAASCTYGRRRCSTPTTRPRRSTTTPLGGTSTPSATSPTATRTGYYYIADRKNDMIISGGMNIYPAEIEAALDASPDIYEVAVFGIPNEEWGESVHAVVVPAREGVTEQDVTSFAREHLAGYKVPRSVSFADELPKTGSGKVLKRQLREPFWPAPA